jgi:hypothetical protein
MSPIMSKMTVVAAMLALLLAGCGGGVSRSNLAQYSDMPESAQRGRLNASDDIDSSRGAWLHETKPAWR